MKIAITGHTSGIGKAIGDYFAPDNSVLGFSKSSGYDIKLPQDRIHIREQSLECDIFVNNAYSNFDDAQLEMLRLIHSSWAGTDKLIINISSRYTTNPKLMYCTTKRELDNFCEQNIFNAPAIVNLKPGLTDTPRVNTVEGQKMSVDLITGLLDYIIRSRHTVKIHSVSFGY
jgi:NAD(P)-dependent dehydrogenase (short-subunit alcohol dehydrogenase family)